MLFRRAAKVVGSLLLCLAAVTLLVTGCGSSTSTSGTGGSTGATGGRTGTGGAGQGGAGFDAGPSLPTCS